MVQADCNEGMKHHSQQRVRDGRGHEVTHSTDFMKQQVAQCLSKPD